MIRTTGYVSLFLALTLLSATVLPFSASSKTNNATTVTPVALMLHSPAEQPTLGNDVLVGSFILHVQIQQKSVSITPRGGSHAADVPATDLKASFDSWDPASKTAKLLVSINNTGTASLVGPIGVTITKIASPEVTAVNADAGTGFGSWTFSYGSAQLGPTPILSSGETSSAKQWQFVSPNAKAFQVEVEISAGVPLAPGVGATIEGEDGTSITVQPNSIPYEVLIDSKVAPPSDVTAPLGDLEFSGAMNVTFEPIAATDVPPPSSPLTLSMPAPSDASTGKFVVGQQMPVDNINIPEPALTDQLVATDTAALVNGNMVTQADFFPGIFAGGLFVFVANHGSGFATGQVSDSTGVRPGARVSNKTKTQHKVAKGSATNQQNNKGGPLKQTAFQT
jgi:hypothetical protein